LPNQVFGLSIFIMIKAIDFVEKFQSANLLNRIKKNYKSMFDQRVSGILLHPTSLANDYGIGDLGKGAYDFIDFLVESKQQIWQILPLGPTGYGNSPYQCYSSIAGNPLLISLEFLQQEGLLTFEALNYGKPNFPINYVDFELVIPYKIGLLEKAYQNFLTSATLKEERARFAIFKQEQGKWLEDYALFMALKEDYNGASWYEWDPKIVKREHTVLLTCQEKLHDRIGYHQFLQYLFFKQWLELKKYANEKNILIFGDIPIYVAHDSADVWSHPDHFMLDPKTGEATLMAGVPPDYFSETGQLWGNPVYNWETLEFTNFQWWIERIKKNLSLVDILRIDHFRGFDAFWAVPHGEETAIKGEWVQAPGQAFFKELQKQMGHLPIVAEDLGVITPEVEKLRDDFNFPGMKILQFAFDSGYQNEFLPFNYPNHRCVVYTGTHDNDTTAGWFEARSDEEKSRVVDYLGCIGRRGIHWSLIQLALGTVANLAIFPFQDLLGLGTDARMNRPGIAEGNWAWRLAPDSLNVDIKGHLAYLTTIYGRAPLPQPQEIKIELE